VQLLIDEAVPHRGARVFSGEREVGWVTSAVRSLVRGPLALGYVHRDVASAKTVVDVDVDGHRCAATVTAVVGG
jgi:glycine cleavage system aminomethyltransferase T